MKIQLPGHQVPLVLLLATVLNGCGQARNTSLVADWPAPDPSVLAGETIEVGRDVGEVGGVMSRAGYTIKPGGYVHFIVNLDNGGPMVPTTTHKTVSKGDFRLSAEQYREALSRLALLHPNEPEDTVQPKGCQHIYDDPFKAQASFSTDGKYLGAFQLQY